MTAAPSLASPPRPPEPDQDAVVRFLSDPASYEPKAAEVGRIETHGALVFLAGERAYKIKRAVRYPYMDFSTLEKRRRACERELALNSRTAPALYREVVPVARDAEGNLKLGGSGEPVEWVLIMARFAQDRLLSNLAAADGLTPKIVDDLADAIAAFHDHAPPVFEGLHAAELWGARSIEWVVVENNEELAARGDLFAPKDAARLAAISLDHLKRHTALLDARARTGLQRLCHGDLHLRNVVLLDGRPQLFDAIEFNDAIACIDVFYDLAFLLMDLEHRELRSFANQVLNRYLHRRGDLRALPLLPLFLSARATVRAKVAASLEALEHNPQARQERREEATGYFTEALEFLEPAPARLVAVGGLSGSGKSSLARRLAPHLGAAPGAVHLRSDLLRKAMAGVEDEQRLPAEAYNRAASGAVYARMMEQAAQVLDAGHSVVLDAVFAGPEERAAVAELAKMQGVDFTGLWLWAEADVLKQRVTARRHDASDATAAVVEQQLGYDLGRVDWTRVDARGPLEAVAKDAYSLLRLRP